MNYRILIILNIFHYHISIDLIMVNTYSNTRIAFALIAKLKRFRWESYLYLP